MSKRMTAEEWHKELEAGYGPENIKEILWDWQNDRTELLKSVNAWKRAAKFERHFRIEFWKAAYEAVEELERTRIIADRLLELLKELESRMANSCLICYGILNWIGDVAPPNIGHTEDCELAKELGEEE